MAPSPSQGVAESAQLPIVGLNPEHVAGGDEVGRSGSQRRHHPGLNRSEPAGLGSQVVTPSYRRLRAGHLSTMADSVAGTGAERCEPARSYRGHGTTVGQCPTGFPIA